MFKRVLVVALMAALCGCGKDEEKISTEEGEVTVQNDGQRVTVKTADGTAVIDSEGGKTEMTTPDGTFSVGQVDIPKDFPLPIMSGGKVQYAMHQRPKDGEEVFSASFKTSAAVDEAAAFYRKALEDKKCEIDQMEISSPEGKGVTLSGASQAADIVVAVFREGNETIVTLTWTNKKT